jgi:hypothetical protein
VKFRVCVFIGCLALAPAAYAADEPVDPGLLEFLGSVDTEDKNWHEYLAHTDIDRVAKRAGNARANPAPAPSDPSAAASAPHKDPPASPPAPKNLPVNQQ